MPTYQLRLPDSRRLDDWLDEVSWATWDEVVHHTTVEPLGPHAFVRIRQILRERFESTVKAYRSCGLWSYCRAGARPSAWMPEACCRPEEHPGPWYLLEAPQGLPGVVADATDRLGEFLTCFLGGPLPRRTMETAVETALRRGVGPYLYENPGCGSHPFCDARIPLNPWLAGEDAADGAYV